MDKEQTLEAIKVMLHFAGGGEVEMTRRFIDPEWEETHKPFWTWLSYDYRIKRSEQ